MFFKVQGSDFIGNLKLGISEFMNFRFRKDARLEPFRQFFDQFFPGLIQIRVIDFIFQHFAPVGFVRNELGKEHFRFAGVFACSHFQNGQCLHRPLIDPAVEPVAFSRDADFDIAG